jgi:DNA gyrase/topoisomerase IV subunit A
MNIKELNTRERILAGLVIIAIVLGGYGLVRFQAKQNDINKLTLQRDATLNRLAKMDIPNEPKEDIDDIKRALDDQEKALEALKEHALQVESHLAPADSQELKVRISQLAIESGVKIKVNEVLKPPTVRVEQTNKKRRDKPQEQSSEVILPINAGWVARLSPGSMYQRPLQRLEVDGDFLSLRRFIHGLEMLPYQVTVVRLNINKLDVAPLRNMSQLLKTELVLAL